MSGGDWLTGIIKLENQMELLVKLKLSASLTHNDVKALQSYLFCKQESVQFDLFRIHNRDGPQSENERRALERYNMFEADNEDFFNISFSSHRTQNQFSANDTLSGLDSQLNKSSQYFVVRVPIWNKEDFIDIVIIFSIKVF